MKKQVLRVESSRSARERAPQLGMRARHSRRRGSVGHAGASGYLAVMALVGVAPERMKPTALFLNIIVATVATWNFRRAGVFYPKQTLPLAIGSVLLAFLGGTFHPSTWYRPLLALVLAFGAARLLLKRTEAAETGPPEPHLPWLAALGI